MEPVDSTVQKDICTIREGNICIEVEAQTFSLPMVKCSDTTPNSKHHTGFLSQRTNRTTTEAGVGTVLTWETETPCVFSASQEAQG